MNVMSLFEAYRGCLFKAALAALAFQSVAASAQQPDLPWADAAPAPEMTPERARRVMPPVVLSVPGMAEVQVERDLRYTAEPDPLLSLDVYRPNVTDQRPRPVVLFVHGGTDARGRTKDWGLYQSWGRLVAASGFVGVTFTHRLGFSRPGLADASKDLADALAFVRTNASRFGMDPERICIAAFSAGGPLLADYLVNSQQGLKCLVAWYPLMDIRQSKNHLGNEPAEALTRFSNLARIDGPGRKTPLLLIRAGRDEVPSLLDSIDRFVAGALRSNYPLTLLNHPEAPHGFENQLNDQRTREIILSMLAFLQHHLSDPSAGPDADSARPMHQGGSTG